MENLEYLHSEIVKCESKFVPSITWNLEANQINNKRVGDYCLESQHQQPRDSNIRKWNNPWIQPHTAIPCIVTGICDWESFLEIYKVLYRKRVKSLFDHELQCRSLKEAYKIALNVGKESFISPPGDSEVRRWRDRDPQPSISKPFAPLSRPALPGEHRFPCLYYFFLCYSQFISHAVTRLYGKRYHSWDSDPLSSFTRSR